MPLMLRKAPSHVARSFRQEIPSIPYHLQPCLRNSSFVMCRFAKVDTYVATSLYFPSSASAHCGKNSRGILSKNLLNCNMLSFCSDINGLPCHFSDDPAPSVDANRVMNTIQTHICINAFALITLANLSSNNL